MALTTESELLLMEPGKAPRHVVTLHERTDGGSLAPDGRSAYVSTAGNCGEILRVDLASGAVERTGIRGSGPQVSPDGSRLAYTTTSPRWDTCGTALTVRELHTGTERTWRSPDDIIWSMRVVGWSPDGRHLAYLMSWESPYLSGVVDIASAPGPIGPSPSLDPGKPNHEWRASTFLRDGKVALVGWCCWYYIPEHRHPSDIEQPPRLLLATPGQRPVDVAAVPSASAHVHPDGEHLLWVGSDGVLWTARINQPPARVADGIAWATW